LAVEIGILVLKDRVKSLSLDELHYQILLPIFREAEFRCLDNPRVFELHRDVAFGRLFEALKAGLEGGTFFGIENLQSDGVSRFTVLRHVEARHGAADRFAQKLEPLRHIDAAVFEDSREFFEKAESHAAALDAYDLRGKPRRYAAIRGPELRPPRGSGAQVGTSTLEAAEQSSKSPARKL